MIIHFHAFIRVPFYIGHTYIHVQGHTFPHTAIKLDFPIHKINGSSLCCRPMIKVIVTLICKGGDCFSMCAEQIVPASSCDQEFSSFWASLNYCCCWIVAHRTHLLSTCFLVVNKSKPSIIDQILELQSYISYYKTPLQSEFLTVVII